MGKTVLNFSTPNAYAYFVKCKDNHIAWQSFQALLHGTVMELFHHFEDENDQSLTPETFLNWQAEIKNPTLRLLFELFLNFGLGLFFQRVGDRFNNQTLSMAGRSKFVDLFYAFHHHTKKSSIEICEILCRILRK